MEKVASIEAQQNKMGGHLHCDGIVDNKRCGLMLQLASTPNWIIWTIILEHVAEIKASIEENETKLRAIEMNSDWGQYIKVRYGCNKRL